MVVLIANFIMVDFLLCEFHLHFFLKAGFMLGTHQLSLFQFEAFPQTGWTAENWRSACLDPRCQVILQETILMRIEEEKDHFRVRCFGGRLTWVCRSHHLRSLTLSSQPG